MRELEDAPLLDRNRSRPRNGLSRPYLCCCPAPGGEPLCKHAALSAGCRRLPGITAGRVLPSARVTAYPLWVIEHAGSFSGAACLATDRSANLQSGSPPGAGCHMFVPHSQFSRTRTTTRTRTTAIEPQRAPPRSSLLGSCLLFRPWHKARCSKPRSKHYRHLCPPLHPKPSRQSGKQREKKV
jgi:hypothetical protein